MARQLLLPIALCAAALAMPAAATGQERTVSVTGSVTEKVPNDSAAVGFGISQRRGSRGAALRIVARRARAVIAAAQTIPGVGAGDVTTGRISVRRANSGKHALYRAGEGIHVILHQPDKAGELAAAGVRAGATGVSGPDFFVGDTAGAYRAALAAAFDQAKERAAALAARAGAALGPAISIEEGASGGEFVAGPVEDVKGASGCAETVVKGTTPKGPASASVCAGAPPVKPGTSTVTATVHVVFALQ
jgi:uncharacterized protein YggE